MRSTQEWETTLEEATPAPWRFKFGGYVIGQEGEYVFNWRDTSQENAALLGLAPEAVAEVVRLRRQLEELRDHNMLRWGRMIHHETDDNLQWTAFEAKETANRITHILEDTHE